MNTRIRTARTLATLLACLGTLACSGGSAWALSLGHYTYSTSFGSLGSGAGQLSGPTGVAVDENPASSSYGDVYVADSGNARIDKFNTKGEFIMAWGYGVADGTTEALQTCTIVCFAGIPGEGAGQLNAPGELAIDNSNGPSADDLYVGDPANKAIEKFTSTGAFINNIASGGYTELNGAGVAVNPEGDVWSTNKGEVDSEPEYNGAIVNGQISESQAGVNSFRTQVAADSLGNVYFDVIPHSEEAYVEVRKASTAGEDAPLDLVARCSCTTGLAVNEQSDALYIDDGTYIAGFSAEGSPLAQPTFELPAGAQGSGIAVYAAAGNIYVADSANSVVDIYGSLIVPDVGTGAATPDIAASSAELHGTVNPDGFPLTSCEFEYGTSISYGSGTVPCAQELSTLTGNTPLAVSADVTGLQPDVLYHFRLAAGNAEGGNHGADEFIPAAPVLDGESAIDVTSTSATLTAQINPAGGDTRYYFQYGADASYGMSLPVPPGKDIGSGSSDTSVSAQLYGLPPVSTFHYRVVAVNADGTVAGPDQSFTTEQAVTTTGLPDGRQYELVSPPNKEGSTIEPIGHGTGDLIQASADGSRITYLAKAPFAGPVGNGTIEGSQIFSVRGPDGWSSQDIETPHETESSVSQRPEYQYFSEDLSLGLAVPVGDTPLSTSARTGVHLDYLRDNSTGAYQPLQPSVSGLRFAEVQTATPDLTHILFAVASGSSPLYEWAAGQSQLVTVYPDGSPTGGDLAGVSADGSHVFWEGAESDVYVRDIDTQKTTLIGGRAEFLTSSSDGSKAFFTANFGQVYEYNAETAHMTDLSVETSSDGSQVSTIPGGLTLLRYTGPAGPVGFVKGSLPRPARVSPDGRYVVFDSPESLTGYNNIAAAACPDEVEENVDLHPEGRCTEVYEYDSVSNHLTCVSCNPSGARPQGSSSIPFVTPTAVGASGGTYLSRALSSNGRVFFDSRDALLPHDTNGLEDVYEWEPDGVGSCQVSAGCLYLISSGTSGDETSFLDASVDGNDIFFLTREQLVSQDYDNSVDVYDAHVCSATAPCFPIASAAPPPCASSDACKAGPTPQPAIFGAPASATFTGAGNPTPPSPAPAVKKTKTKAKAKPKARKRTKDRKHAKHQKVNRKGRK